MTKRRKTKAQTKRMQEYLDAVSVDAYWNERLRERRALAFVPLIGHGYDYFGSMPWPSFVAIDAFFEDYKATGHFRPMSRSRFITLFRDTSGVGQAVRKPVDKEATGPLLRSMNQHRSYYDIEPLRPRATETATERRLCS